VRFTPEAVNATGAEIDLEPKVWSLPPSRMKAGRSHTVPLSDRTKVLLDALLPKDVAPEALFFLDGGEPISNMAAPMLLRRTGITTHGGWL
jgi:integrase